MRILLSLLLLFTLGPLVELTLLLMIADWTNWKVSLGLVLTTAIAGATLSRSQGVRAVRRIQDALQQGELPGDALLDAALILAAGMLLITPGVLTDLIAISVMIPWTRAIYKRGLLRWLRTRVQFNASFRFRTGTGAETRTDYASGRETIDSYVIRDEEDGT